jgi:hypothetical protein
MEIETEGEVCWDGMEKVWFIFGFLLVGAILEVNIMIFLGDSSSKKLAGKPGGPTLSSRAAPSPHILPPNKKTTSVVAYSS